MGWVGGGLGGWWGGRMENLRIRDHNFGIRDHGFESYLRPRDLLIFFVDV